MKWFEKLAASLEGRGRRRMIYREHERVHSNQCGSISNAAGRHEICADHCKFHEPPVREDYLERFYILSTPWLGIYLHRFWAGDDDGLHDHPWNSLSILLSGSYTEEEPERHAVPYGPTIKRVRRPFHPWFKLRTKHAAHRITLTPGDEGAWSLFIRFGVKRRTWGFYRNRGWEAAEVQSRKHEQK